MKKIVVIGPESTGKSTLCVALAQHYQTSWCPEYAREYLLAHGNQYTYDTLLTIAQGQLRLEEQYIGEMERKGSSTAGQFLFIDTNMYVMQVWCQFVFGRVHHWIQEQVKQRQYHLYLLCSTDLPWVKDELREYPDLQQRQQLYHIYRNIMLHQHTPWAEISGMHEQRLEKAVAAVDRLLTGGLSAG